MLKLVVLVSGGGSNLQAIINAIQDKSLDAEIKMVISDKSDAFGLERAKKIGIKTAALSPKDFADRAAYDENLAELVAKEEPDLVVLAGFMLVLGEGFLNKFHNKVVNIHPALLPSFPGVNGQKQAWDYGVKIAGCTVHIVDTGVDTGPIIAQRAVPVLDDDTAESLAARILEQEHKIYPEVLRLWAAGRIELSGRKVFIK